MKFLEVYLNKFEQDTLELFAMEIPEIISYQILEVLG